MIPIYLDMSLAERIIQTLNKSTVGPCEDFYSYVCHGWLQDNPSMAQATKTSYNMDLKERIEAALSAFIEGLLLRTVCAVPLVFQCGNVAMESINFL